MKKSWLKLKLLKNQKSKQACQYTSPEEIVKMASRMIDKLKEELEILKEIKEEGKFNPEIVSERIRKIESEIKSFEILKRNMTENNRN